MAAVADVADSRPARDTRARSWVFTLNNPTNAEEAILHVLPCKYVCFGREVGEGGTPHLQGFLQFNSPMKFSVLSKRLGSRYHIERAGAQPGRAIAYCKKGDQSKDEWDRLKDKGPNFGLNADVYERGDIPIGGVGKKCTIAERAERNARLLDPSVLLGDLARQGEIDAFQIRALKNARYDVAQEGPGVQTEDVRGVWIYGPPGTGKTHYARHTYPGAYVKAQNKWFDGYCGEQYIILDDLDTPVLGHYLKIWADRWSTGAEVKGGKINLKHLKFVVTSNYHPRELWPASEDPRNAALCAAIVRRFDVVHMPFRRDLAQAEPAEDAPPRPGGVLDLSRSDDNVVLSLPDVIPETPPGCRGEDWDDGDLIYSPDPLPLLSLE